MMPSLQGVNSSPFQQFQVGQSIKQNSEANILAAQSEAKRSPIQNIKSELAVDTSAPVRNTPLQQPTDNGNIIADSSRGSNLNISV